ncbi:hypothetical protein A9K66_10760 [Mesorhizobium sp. AA23]|nr:hypothetical protein A9K66_10760 [Mesorhizobium sp. AA23]
MIFKSVIFNLEAGDREHEFLSDALGEEILLRLNIPAQRIGFADDGPDFAAFDLRATEELEETAKLFLMLHGRELRPLTPEQRNELSDSN